MEVNSPLANTARNGVSQVKQPRRKRKVVLNIYDLQSPNGRIDVPKWNNILIAFGLGAFHTGIEIFNWEISFSMNGANGK